MLKKIAIFSFVVSTITGCGVAHVSNNRSALLKLNPGDTKEQLVQLMGDPYLREVYPQGEVWFYRTSLSEGKRNSLTPVVVNNGKVVGWGENYYDTTIKKKLDVNIKTN